MNSIATIRDYLMKATNDLAITTNIDSIKLQATSLAQLTQATNELSRKACVITLTFVKLHPISFSLDTRFDEMLPTCCCTQRIPQECFL